MAFKGYFDGGNQADSTQYETVTLAGVSGSGIQWTNLEEQFGRALARHGAPWLHTSDALHYRDPYLKSSGWNEQKVHDLIDDCVKVIERCAATLDKAHRYFTYAGIRPSALTVVLKDFQRLDPSWKAMFPPERLCATWCVGGAVAYGIATGFERCQLYFDRSEPFKSHIEERWQRRDIRRDSPPLQNISFIGSSDMRSTPALQVADVIAWSINDRYKNRGTRYDWQKRLLAIDMDYKIMDRKTLSQKNKADFETVQAWNLPRRKPLR